MNDIGKNLKRIRLLKNLSLDKAGKLLNMSAPAIAKYEKGQIIPNSEKLIEFSKAYGVKVLDLIKTHDVVDMKFTAFRKKQRLKGQNLELLKEIIQNKVTDYLEVVSLNEIKSNKRKYHNYPCETLEEAEKTAESFRKDYDLSINQPIPNLIHILENIGIIIILIDNPDHRFDDFDGLSEIVNDIPVIVLLNDCDGARQRFTLAHELGHLLLNITNSENIEKMCNGFAASLLMPKQAVINEFGEKRDNIDFFELIAFKKEYKVSMAAIVYRLKELNIISDYLFKKINIEFSAIGIRKKEPIEIIQEESDQYKKLVHKLEVNNIITKNRACELLDITLNEYNNQNNYYRY